MGSLLPLASLHQDDRFGSTNGPFGMTPKESIDHSRADEILVKVDVIARNWRAAFEMFT